MTNTNKARFLRYTATFAIAASLGSVSAYGQTSETSVDEDEVVVTGSRIKRDTNANSAVPLQVFGGVELEEGGTTDLAEALIQLPGVSNSISPKTSNSSIQSSGLSTISLRRLGDDRTLVLINGKRAVSNSGNNDRVSLSTLPAGFVERTEITTGGASAVYGSDAIAGVANFLLEDDKKGFEVDARYSTPEASGGEEFRLNASYGTKFDKDRGYVFIAGSFRDENMIRADGTRPESIRAVEFDDPDTSSDDAFANEINAPGCDPNNEDRHCLLSSLSSSTPGGFFEGGDAWFRDGRWYNDRDLTPGDRPPGTDAFSDVDGYNFRPGRSLLGSREVMNIGLHTEYEIASNVDGSLVALYSDIDSATAGGYETLNNSDEYGVIGQDRDDIGGISSSHPFIPPEVEATRSGSVSFGRRLVELGEQQRINNRKTVRLIADLEGPVNDRFDWQLYGTYGKYNQEQSNPNEYNIRNAAFALDVEEDGLGGYQCADADARADGCVPLNIFGENTISPEAADYIRYNGFSEQSRTQYTGGGFISGDVFDLPAGPLKGVLGVEYRREEQNTIGDPDGDLVGGIDGDPTTPDADITSFTTFPSLQADYDIIEGYAEIDLPLKKDVFSVQAAARVADYSTFGSIYSYNLGAVWTPSDWVRVRSQLSRAQRAPNITELFSPPRPDFDDLLDPCDGLNPDGTGIDAPAGDGGENADLEVVARNCLSEPGIQAYFADPDNAGDPFETSDSAFGPNSGNRNLKEETADTFTAGIVIQPEFADDLTFIVDYYQIDIDDAITSISTQNVVDLCYSSNDFPNSQFCSVITRNASDGGVDQVINFQENLNNETVEGIDASLKYGFEVGGIPGSWDVDLRYSHYLTQEVRFEGIGGEIITTSPLGTIDNGKNEFRAKLGYRTGPFRMTYTMDYVEGGVDDPNQARPSDNRYFRLGDETFHRLYASYKYGDDDQYRIYAGVNNLFDNLGPINPTGTLTGSSLNITGDLNDPVGREFYIGARAKF